MLVASFITLSKQHFTHTPQALYIDIVPVGVRVGIIKTQDKWSRIARSGLNENWSREVHTKSFNISQREEWIMNCIVCRRSRLEDTWCRKLDLDD